MQVGRGVAQALCAGQPGDSEVEDPGGVWRDTVADNRSAGEWLGYEVGECLAVWKFILFEWALSWTAHSENTSLVTNGSKDQSVGSAVRSLKQDLT